MTSKEIRINFSAKAKNVRFDDDNMWVELQDGRVLGVPLAWFPRFLHADRKKLENVRISNRGLHWENLNEDISIADLLSSGNQSFHVKTT